MSPEELQFFIRYSRKQHGWSQKKMAERLELAPETLRTYELDIRSLRSIETLARILKELGYELTVIRRKRPSCEP